METIEPVCEVHGGPAHWPNARTPCRFTAPDHQLEDVTTEPGAIRCVIVERYCEHVYDRSDILGHWVDDEWCPGVETERRASTLKEDIAQAAGPAVETQEWLAIPLGSIDVEGLRDAATLNRADLIAHDWRKVEMLHGFVRQVLDMVDQGGGDD